MPISASPLCLFILCPSPVSAFSPTALSVSQFSTLRSVFSHSVFSTLPLPTACIPCISCISPVPFVKSPCTGPLPQLTLPFCVPCCCLCAPGHTPPEYCLQSTSQHHTPGRQALCIESLRCFPSMFLLVLHLFGATACCGVQFSGAGFGQQQQQQQQQASSSGAPGQKSAVDAVERMLNVGVAFSLLCSYDCILHRGLSVASKVQ